jgi:ATP-dependent DNA helicase RecG
MTLQDLEQIVAAGESETMEFKKSTAQLPRAGETLCAFLNGQGGRVFIGITPEGRVLGQQIADSTLREVAATLARFEPPALISRERIALPGGSEVIVLSAPAAVASGPFAFDGRAYQRVGSTTSVMPQARYQNLLLERAHPQNRWEKIPVPSLTVGDLDAEEIQRTVDTAIRLGRMSPLRDRSEESILRGLGLMEGGQLLQAAVVLFGQSSRLQSDYPQCSFRLARFRGRDRLSDFADNRQYWGHAFDLLRRAEAFLMDHVPIPGRVPPDRMVREDRPWYPPRTTREAMANALRHRDYCIPGGAVAVAMYDDRLEISSPGTLHFGITVEDLVKPHASLPWNPLIAGVFHRAGIIERWGSGTLNIVDWCRDNHNPPPRWQETWLDFTLTFWPVREPETAQDQPKTGPGPAHQTEPVSTRPVPDRYQSLTEKVLSLLAEGSRSVSEISTAIGQKRVSGQLKIVLGELLTQQQIELTIPDKPRSRWQRYRLTEKGRAWLSAHKP